ncbi:uncharacterized protein [Battus philenor]|uniref:uncharacterized protein n=1 Tax=Battus philenor TaxID=42288 RepID=UPI0035CF7804
MAGTDTLEKSITRPKPLIDLLPGLTGIFPYGVTKDTIQIPTDKKPARTTMAVTRTNENALKPIPYEAMTPHLKALKPNQPLYHTRPQSNNTNKKKTWNSSVKVQKTINHTSNNQISRNSVRKVLKFLPKPKPVSPVKAPVNAETPRFPKPQLKTKKPFLLRANVRVSGIGDIPETPATKCDPRYIKKMPANIKKDINLVNNLPKACVTPVSKQKIPSKRPTQIVPDTPLSNMSWKSSGDASFLQAEQEIKDVEDKKALNNNQMLENVINNSLLVSTPFKEYRHIQNLFNNTLDNENSMLEGDNTITDFDKVLQWKENTKREESVIVSLCDKFKEATLKDYVKDMLPENLLEFKRQTEHAIQIVDHNIKSLMEVKESQMKSLQCVNKLIDEMAGKYNKDLTAEGSEALVKIEATDPVIKTTSKPCSVIKSCSKSPTYKIPKKNMCLRKKVFHKSMPNISNGMQTPNKSVNNKALDVYLKMKEQMDFLNTPVKHYRPEILDTPATTSHNLQMQLDKLYNCS